MEDFSPLVSAKWLYQHLNDKNLVILDASMKKSIITNQPTNLNEPTIPHSLYFDFEDVFIDKKSTLPHMMPSPVDFENEVQKLGINSDSLIIVYDRVGTYSSPRAWWMFRSMGHQNVFVLDGGLPAWLAENYSTEPISLNKLQNGNFKAQQKNSFFCDVLQVENNLKNPMSIIVDARSERRFKGLDPEPRSGLRRGHIPKSINIPFGEIQLNGKMKNADEIKFVFNQKMPSNSKKIIFSCGSGVTACILALGATIAKIEDISVYDGSWSEWGLPSDRKIEI
jgi:thiosulfate/3-mercaptopyruvate sulfurtransferase